jgi:hypothetical protein
VRDRSCKESAVFVREEDEEETVVVRDVALVVDGAFEAADDTRFSDSDQSITSVDCIHFLFPALLSIFSRFHFATRSSVQSCF